MVTRVIIIVKTILFALILPGCVTDLPQNNHQAHSLIADQGVGPLKSKSLVSEVNSKVVKNNFQIISENILKADGVDVGFSAYELIRRAYGRQSIEAPDLYSTDHQGIQHIYEDRDAFVGDHFVFTAHRDADGDKGAFIDRSRNEIKVYAASSDRLKGYKDSVFEYRWAFKIDEKIQVTRRFTHFFQLKAVGGDDKRPIITITANEYRGDDRIQLRHSPQSSPDLTNTLSQADLTLLRGHWVEVFCRATYSDNGAFEFKMTRMADNLSILSVRVNDIDMWRGEESGDFVRPKWGIYRSLVETEKLRASEDTVAFAQFNIREVKGATSRTPYER